MENTNKSIKSKEQKTPNENKISNSPKEPTTLKGISTFPLISISSSFTLSFPFPSFMSLVPSGLSITIKTFEFGM